MRIKDPYKNCKFKIEIDGLVLGGFTDCSGLSSQIDKIDYKEGGDPFTRKIPGKVTFSDIVLKSGITDNRELYNWHKSVLYGVVERKNGSIILMDDVNEEKLRWNFFDAWPSKWDGPTLAAKGAEVAIESMTLSCERIEEA